MAFANPYSEEPIIQLTPIGRPDGYYISASSATGFTIELSAAASGDRKFNWTATLVLGAAGSTDTTASSFGTGTITTVETVTPAEIVQQSTTASGSSDITTSTGTDSSTGETAVITENTGSAETPVTTEIVVDSGATTPVTTDTVETGTGA